MVAGHLREKSGYYYAVLNYTDSLGKRKTKWISTGLTVKGNKKRAEAILMDARRNFNPEEPKVMNGDILFADYMEKWLDIIKSSVAVPTFASYSTTVKKIVAPYFREKEVTLKNLTAKDIQEFYLSELERVSPSSVIHYHANIKLCHVRHDNLRQHLLVDVMGRTGIFAARCITVADIRLVFRLFLGNLFAVVPHIPHRRSTVHTPQQTAEQGNRAALAAAPSCRVVVHSLNSVPRFL